MFPNSWVKQNNTETTVYLRVCTPQSTLLRDSCDVHNSIHLLQLLLPGLVDLHRAASFQYYVSLGFIPSIRVDGCPQQTSLIFDEFEFL